MKKIIVVALAVLITGCSIIGGKNKKEEDPIYGIYTKFGVIKIKLYDDTPLHKANFEKLVAESYYDSTLFHRVINNFMIQGGDPESKNAPAGQMLGSGSPGYTIPSEISDTLYHFKGALAAARQGDQVNPLKASSGSQFYIVHGQKVTEQMLSQVETGINNQRKQALTNEVFNDSANIYLKERILFFRQIQNKDSFDHYLAKINAIVDKEFNEKEFHYTDSAKAKYIRIGGTPNLDANYTVFGEVVEGLNIVDSIAMVKTNRGDRPAEDVIIKIKRIN